MNTNEKIAYVVEELLQDYQKGIDFLMSICESPIEKYFLISAYSYFSKGIYNFDQVSFLCSIAKTSFNPQTKQGQWLEDYHFLDAFKQPTIIKGFKVEGGNYTYEIIPQFTVDCDDHEYRIDIAIFYNYEYLNGTKKGQKIEKKYAIECDGYEWHSSKDQQTRDNFRSRRLQELGWIVLRYSGQEIFQMQGGQDFGKVLISLEKMLQNGH